uniref:Secreted protein n=1 Tax=Anopheles dirus TaxID=7168 RepID=A0A182NW12_9DIPT
MGLRFCSFAVAGLLGFPSVGRSVLLAQFCCSACSANENIVTGRDFHTLWHTGAGGTTEFCFVNALCEHQRTAC